MSSRVPMRDGYGKALMELCEKRKDVMVLDADVAKSTRTVWIRDKYPEHFLDMGISEQDMVGTAAGLALSLVLGVVMMAVGFVFCAAGGYFAGYAVNGYVAYMPDLLLVCGGALGCFALALLFLWLGLWFIVGGIAALVRVTGRTYRRILRKKAGEDEDDE